MVVSTSVELARVLGCLECGRLVQKLSANRFGVLVAPQYPYADIISRVILPPSSEDPPGLFFSLVKLYLLWVSCVRKSIGSVILPFRSHQTILSLSLDCESGNITRQFLASKPRRSYSTYGSYAVASISLCTWISWDFFLMSVDYSYSSFLTIIWLASNTALRVNKISIPVTMHLVVPWNYMVLVFKCHSVVPYPCSKWHVLVRDLLCGPSCFPDEVSFWR